MKLSKHFYWAPLAMALFVGYFISRFADPYINNTINCQQSALLDNLHCLTAGLLKFMVVVCAFVIVFVLFTVICNYIFGNKETTNNESL